MRVFWWTINCPVRWQAGCGSKATRRNTFSTFNWGQAKDNPVWQHAQSVGAVIVSKDEDFAEWVRRGRPGPAVVWLRLGNSTRRELLL